MSESPKSLCLTIPSFEDPSSSLTYSRLRCSYSPSDSETDEICESIESISSQIAMYKVHLQSLRETVLFLERQKRKAKAERKRKKSLLAPIRRLPPEVLGEIFRIYCLDEVERAEHLRVKRYKRLYSESKIPTPALILGRVCLLWRDVALNNPRVWPNVRIRLEDVSKKDLELLSVALRQSKQTELFVDASIEAHRGRIGESADNARSGFGMLLGHSDRWKQAKLAISWRNFGKLGSGWEDDSDDEGQDEQEQERQVEPRQLDFSRLEVLDLALDYDVDGPEQCQRYGIIGSAALSSALNLRRLSINRDPAYFPKLPFSSLTSLTLNLFVQEYVGIIDQSKCPNLQSLTISWAYNWDDPIVDSLPISTSSSLTHVSMDNIDVVLQPDRMLLFQYLCLPKLESLEIRGLSPSFYDHHESGTSEAAAFIGMLKRSKPLLKRLVLENIYFTGEGWAEVLPLLTSLTHLEMPMQTRVPSSLDCEMFVKNLISDPMDDENQESRLGTLLPNLEALSLSLRKMMYAPLMEAICDMLDSRLSFLVSFKICVDRGWHDDAFPHIRRFRALAREKSKILLEDNIPVSRLEPSFCFEWLDWGNQDTMLKERHTLDLFSSIDEIQEGGNDLDLGGLLGGWDHDFCEASRELRLGWTNDL